jgi:hypothetical protein
MELDHDLTKLARMPVESTDGLFVIFHHETRKDEEASAEAGKPIYKAIPYVEIIAPGNDKERINRRVKEEDKKRFPNEWKAFEEGREAPDFNGMPVTEWPQVDRAIARTLHESNIFTVEQLAEVPDVNLQTLGMGMMNLKSKAKKWVKASRGKSEELAEAKHRIAELEKKLDALDTQVKIEPIIKDRGWYTFRGKKYREADLPPEAAALFKDE